MGANSQGRPGPRRSARDGSRTGAGQRKWRRRATRPWQVLPKTIQQAPVTCYLHRVRVLGLLLAVAALLVASTVYAQAPGGPDPKALFDEGLKDMLAGNFGIGCPLIKRSRDLDPRPGTTFTLAECYRRAGKVASAVELYDEFLALYDTMPNDEQGKQAARWKISKQERANLLNRVPWLTVALPLDAPADAVILLDDEPFSGDLLEVAFAIDPGTHEFRTRAPGGRWTRTLIQLQEGQRLRATLNVSHPGQAASYPPVDDLEPDSPKKKVSPWFWVAGSVGLAGLATGAVTGGLLLSRANTVKEGCSSEQPDGTFQCNQRGWDALQSTETLAPLTTASLSVGAGGVVIATIIWLARDRSPAAVSGPSALSPTFRVGRDGGGAGITGHF